MALNADNIQHHNAGGVATTSISTPITVALAGGEQTTAESTMVVVYFFGGTGVIIPAASGWSRTAVGNGLYRLHRIVTSGLAAGESSWDFTPSSTSGGPISWAVVDLTGTDDALDASTGSTLGTSGTTLQHLSAVTSTYDGLAISVHAAIDTASTTPTGWSGHSDSFAEIVEHGQAGASSAVSVSLSARGVQSIGQFGAQATASRTLTGTDYGMAHTIVISAAGARRAANLRYFDGAEHGTASNNTVVAGNLLSTQSAGVSVSTTAKRSGDYGWLLTSTSAACNFTTTYAGLLSTTATATIQRRAFRFPTLPAVDTEIWVLTNSASTTLTLRFIQATGKLGLKIGTGTEQVSDQTVTANQWFAADLWWSYATTAHTTNWQVDYNAELTDLTGLVAQTQATFTAGSGGTSITTYRVGWTNAITATLHTDDGAGSIEPDHYPLGDIRVLPLKVDPAGTPSILGTTGNFGVMTNNGTVAAWNATNARNAVDEVPVDLSGTRDAAVAVTAHATDYAEFPMETLDMAASKVNVRGVRAIACVWAAAATAATIRVTATDGTTSYTIYAEADPGADNASAVWIAKTLRPASGRTDWTQAKVDALAFRFGSNDATPDIGIDSIVFELAVVKAQLEDLAGESGAPVHVQAHRDPDSQALVGATVTNNSGSAIELAWEVDGVPDSSGSIPDGTSGQYVPMSPDGSIETVGKVELV